MLLTRMRARDPQEAHRAATPLELLFDLTFVVAVAAVVPELAHAVVDDHPIEGLIGYLLVFFGIWWAWMNFTWFASAFDCDDAPYRVLTMVQMAGVLVLAAGVEPAFERGDFTTAVAGYVLMRIALVAQWLRVARSVPEYRTNALRYAIPIAAVQLLWILRLALPQPVSIVTFIVLGIVELSIPVYADRRDTTPWHPHHIAERYGLFTIIVLGESVLAATNALIGATSATGLSVDLTIVAIAGLVLLFGCWWLYFLESDAARLEARRERAFVWGYGHFFVFAALAAVGAGIEATIEASAHDVAASSVLIGYSVAVPLAIFLVARYVLYVRLGGSTLARHEVIAAEIAIVLSIPLLGAAVRPVWVLVALATATAGLVVFKSVRYGRVSAREGADTGQVRARRDHTPHEEREVSEGGEGRAPESAETEVPSTG